MVKENGMVMMTEQELERFKKVRQCELDELVDEYQRRIDLMQDAIKQLMKEGATSEDVRVSKADFVAIYNKALDDFFDIMEMPNSNELPNDIDGHDITVHWHGIYCNCSNGAIPTNYIVSAVEEMLGEDDSEY